MASSPSKMPTKPIQVVKGDLFSSPATDSLAHCISEDVRMGAGIAVLFKKKFGRIRELKNQNKKPGEVAFLKDADRYVYYLITKKKASDKPTYESLQKSLEAMRDHCLDNNVSHISMPRIGCGLDKLLWTEVSKILESVFAESGIMITVYSL